MSRVGVAITMPLKPLQSPSFSSTRLHGKLDSCRFSKNRVRCFTAESTEKANSNSYGGMNFEGSVSKEDGSSKLRLDAWLATQIQGVSRARIQSTLRQGLVQVNGRSVTKASHVIRAGDTINCTVSTLPPLRADPEDIPLDIVYEDDHVIVINKSAHMVVHPAPGNAHGTLVNGILHHCGLPSAGCSSEPNADEVEEDGDTELQIHPLDCDDRHSTLSSMNSESIVRPGIVHRLDKGTSGLLVVAKDENAHAQLSDQFKRHTVHRRYISLTCGVPHSSNGYIEIPIGRDLNNRIRMASVQNPTPNRRARLAASRYNVIEVIGGGGAALVEWRLETGRTHQIRVHAQYLGYPLLGDDLYGGTTGMALSRLKPKVASKYHGRLSKLISNLQRPCLHALSLGFEHPQTGKEMKFSCAPPLDFMDVLHQLRNMESK
ncbi:RNA pseudouridine synthase 2, chloroplastic [Cryptomeria japonica]|uniref:RNA pseudouridine synthase 2, chloroplastic n=1 Tax=Cryptomeria japonica TaxID=3369 RepID=UPI0027D9D5F6|nr:RNA pseudouridine synthase 2, chloroplastic [Cryptomeria japonica]